MELYESVFADILEFNDYVNTELINENKRIIPITVLPKYKKLWIFYTIEELED